MNRAAINALPFLTSFIFSVLAAHTLASARELHVALRGNDANPGTRSAPLRHIQAAAQLAQPGDIITVHEGVYRERINPPRGGTSDRKRIIYRAAPGERVEVKGSELVTGWTQVGGSVWKRSLPNSFFGAFNPYTNVIKGDWFVPRNRVHHTGAVYVNGDWLYEATSLDEVLAPPGTPPPAWLNPNGGFLLNVSWLRPVHENSTPTPAASFSAQLGVQKAPCSEGGECVGWIEPGDWIRFSSVDFGPRTTELLLRAASDTRGGIVELRDNAPDGTLLGSCKIPHTGGWQSWATFKLPLQPVSGKKTVCLLFKGLTQPEELPALARLWFAEVNATHTTIWAQFPGTEPNAGRVEINVRQTVFYPDQPGRNFITVRGFTMKHAATPWAPPTAEQIGLIGTHWSKGWIIADNIVSHSVCSGISLGKHGDEFDNTSADTAEGYVKTIERAYQHGWTRENIGHHLVRGNVISHCEQAGIVGSLGAAFSTVTGNTIHDIHVRKLFTGAEMAGIKFHAAIDSTISNNHIYRTTLGLWLDWMAQGTRVSANLFHDNGRDLFMEVNHGPYLVDNNFFLSPESLLDMSEGGAFAHNLFRGRIESRPELGRQTPYHPAHSTEMAGLVHTKGGDCRFYNNIFEGPGQETGGFGLSVYNPRPYPLYTGGNVYLNGSRPWTNEVGHLVLTGNCDLVRVAQSQEPSLTLNATADFLSTASTLVDTRLLGNALVSGLPYENADGSPLKVNYDFRGKKRNKARPTPGPIELRNPGPVSATLIPVVGKPL